MFLPFKFSPKERVIDEKCPHLKTRVRSKDRRAVFSFKKKKKKKKSLEKLAVALESLDTPWCQQKSYKLFAPRHGGLHGHKINPRLDYNVLLSLALSPYVNFNVSSSRHGTPKKRERDTQLFTCPRTRAQFFIRHANAPGGPESVAKDSHNQPLHYYIFQDH